MRNLQGLASDDNRMKSNELPPGLELAELRDLWPSSWQDALPAAIECPAKLLHLKMPRPLAAQIFLAERRRHEDFDKDWLESVKDYFGIVVTTRGCYTFCTAYLRLPGQPPPT